MAAAARHFRAASESSPKRSSTPPLSLHIDPTFAVAAVLQVGPQGAGRGAEHAGLLQRRAGQLAARRGLGERQAGQRGFARRRPPREDCAFGGDPDRAAPGCRSPRSGRASRSRGATRPVADHELVGERDQRDGGEPDQQAAPHSSQPPGQRTSPSTWTSGSSSTPKRSWTRRRPSLISSSTSAVVASPQFSTKLACFSEKRAPPWRRPRQPAASSSCSGRAPSAQGS